MVCAEGCAETVTIGDMSDCCGGDENRDQDVKTDCCDISGTNIKVDIHTVSQKAEAPAVKEIILPPAVVPAQFIVTLPVKTVTIHAPETPPRCSGRSLLVSISRFNV